MKFPNEPLPARLGHSSGLSTGFFISWLSFPVCETESRDTCLLSGVTLVWKEQIVRPRGLVGVISTPPRSPMDLSGPVTAGAAGEIQS